MNFDEEKWGELVRQWEEDEPGVSDVDHPPASNGEMTLPEMDFGEPEGGQLRLRKPSAPEEEPPRHSFEPPAPQQPVEPAKSEAPARRPPPAKSGDMDWDDIMRRSRVAEGQKALSQGAETLFASVGAQSGYRPNAHAGDVWTKTAEQPLEMAKERDAFDLKAKSADRETARFRVQAAMDDPNSLQSQKARESIKAFFGDLPLPPGFESWSASDVQHYANTGQLAQVAARRNADADDARKAAAEQERKGALQTKEGRAAAETDALRREVGKLDPNADLTGLSAVDLRAIRDAKSAEQRARIVAAAKQKKDDEGRPLAPTALADIADADVAKKQVAGLADTFREYDMGTPTAKASAFFTEMLGLQFTDAAKFNAEAKRVQQGVGTILEGGKLAAGDDTKYRKMLLQPGDSPEIVASKTAGMVDFLEDLKAGRIKVYRAGGYKVPAELDSREATVTVVQRKTGKSKTMPKSKADALLSAPGGDAYEVR